MNQIGIKHALRARLQGLSCALTVICFGLHPETASAHENLTNVYLTERSANCADYANTYSATARDVQRKQTFEASVQITTDGTSCRVTSNAVPNHDFNATGRFATTFTTQDQSYVISAKPQMAARPTALSLRYDNAVFLNGVKLDLLAAGCFGVRDGLIGCHDMSQPYRYDPMAGANSFGTDEHNAHTQPDGTYHYHGNPMALFEQDNPDTPSPVIGFAADGFPIFGSYIADGSQVRLAKASYRLKSGQRSGGPGGLHDGTFIDDWEYVDGLGDLDRCNGMIQNGVYGYVVTATYPHVMGCFTGTPNESFRKRRR